MKFSNHYERVKQAQIITREMKNEGFKIEEIIKAVFETTQLTKRWVLEYIEMLDSKPVKK